MPCPGFEPRVSRTPDRWRANRLRYGRSAPPRNDKGGDHRRDFRNNWKLLVSQRSASSLEENCGSDLGRAHALGVSVQFPAELRRKGWEMGAGSSRDCERDAIILRLKEARFGTPPLAGIIYCEEKPRVEIISPFYISCWAGKKKPGVPEKTHRPAASSGTSCRFPTSKNPGFIRPGIEPGSPWWEASSLTAQPPRLPTQYPTVLEDLVQNCERPGKAHYTRDPMGAYRYDLHACLTLHCKVLYKQRPEKSGNSFREKLEIKNWESCRKMTLVGGFSQGSPVSPALSFRSCSVLTILNSLARGPIPSSAWSDFGKPLKTEIRMAGLGIELGSSQVRVEWFYYWVAACLAPPGPAIAEKKRPLDVHASSAGYFKVSSPDMFSEQSFLAFPGRVAPDFRTCEESCLTMPLVGDFSRGSPVSPAPPFRRCSILISITLIGSEDLDVKSRSNLFTHSLLLKHCTQVQRIARRGDGALAVRVTVARIAAPRKRKEKNLGSHEYFANSFGGEVDSRHLFFSPTVVIGRQLFRHAPFNCEPRAVQLTIGCEFCRACRTSGGPTTLAELAYLQWSGEIWESLNIEVPNLIREFCSVTRRSRSYIRGCWPRRVKRLFNGSLCKSLVAIRADLVRSSLNAPPLRSRQANRLGSPAWSFQDFSMWLVGGLSRGSPVSPRPCIPVSAPYSARFALMCSQHMHVKKEQPRYFHSPLQSPGARLCNCHRKIAPPDVFGNIHKLRPLSNKSARSQADSDSRRSLRTQLTLLHTTTNHSLPISWKTIRTGKDS
ncbi:hypothetical protein PR048_010653 [Dryococelus australis]|uniref:Uncharacterized protein n=1 Tax=Dryococelus australis TaxID=614101 RepID=A0ABQ9I3A5_9NEOP|nr:hypothetical protein PR048_010653 [Dryococelus australis]